MIAICPNPFRDAGLKITEKAAALLKAEGVESVICPVFGEDEPGAIPSGIDARVLEQETENCSMVLVVGGDGTVLEAARRLHHKEIPILGINLGTKGFMSTLEPERIELLRKVAHGGYSVSRRMMLSVRLVRDGETICRHIALNDAVLHGYGDCIRLCARCESDKITTFSGDGIILATPTGSTGYSMSAGGPIVEPDAANIIVSPICAHAIGVRPFVLGANRVVTVTAENLHGRRAYLSIDGKWAADLAGGDVLEVSRSEHETLMVDLGLRSFFEAAYDKLS